MIKLFKTQFGSHLYGTDTPSSDLDYKGIFMESLENIVLKKDAKHIQENAVSKGEDGRNTKDAVDCEWVELRTFIDDCLAGQTYALDMLFAPENMWEVSSEIWKDVLANRHLLLSKDVKPYIGYCRHQANKYGLKGSRLGELKRVIEWLKTLPPADILADHVNSLTKSEYVTTEITVYRNTGRDITQDFLVVLGKKFELKSRIKDVLKSLETVFGAYGNRAIQAMNNEGVDWKAVSHAFRCMFQLKELAETGKILFPLHDAEFIRDVKSGKYSWDILNSELFDLMEYTIAKVENSAILPTAPDRKFWDKWVIQQYLN